MKKEELVRQAAKCFPPKVTTVKEEKAFIEGFVRGAEWMQERMIEKAAEFIYDTIFNWADDSYCQTLSECRMDYINKFKKAMEE